MVKFKYIKYVLFVILLIMFGLVVLFFNNNNRINNETEEDVEEYSFEYYKKFYGLVDLTEEDRLNLQRWENGYTHELITILCQKNGNWSKLPITKEVREQYNEKDGILGKVDFDKVEYIPNKEFQHSGNVEIITTKGLEKIKYYITFSYAFDLYDQNSGIDGIEINDVVKLTDKNGNELNPGFPFDDKHIISNFSNWYNVGLTNKYKKKYGDNLLNLFIHYSPLIYNHIGFDIDKSDLSKNMAYFIVNSVLECKKREYEVYYTLDKDKYLDDAEARLVKEVDTEPTDSESGLKAFYLNSNLDNTNLSDKFKQKIQEYGSYNTDISNIDINYEPESIRIEKGKYIRCYKMKDGSLNSYIVEYNGTETEMLYDIVSTRLPYTNIHAEEVKELYLKEYNK